MHIEVVELQWVGARPSSSAGTPCTSTSRRMNPTSKIVDCAGPHHTFSRRVTVHGRHRRAPVRENVQSRTTCPTAVWRSVGLQSVEIALSDNISLESPRLLGILRV